MVKNDCFYGIYPIRLIRHGEWGDPEISYKGNVFNYYEIEDLFYEIWSGEPDYLTANLTSENSTMAAFEKWMTKQGKRVKGYLNYLIDVRRENNGRQYQNS